VRARVGELLRDDPEATFDEVSARMPAGWEGTVFGALSPRHLEAAMTRTPQVLVRGSYSGVLQPDVHYVAVQEDLSDVRDALERALDPGLGRDLAEAAWADLVDSGRYDYDRLTDAVRGELPDTTGAVPRSARRRLVIPAAARAARRWAAAKRPRRGP
jgi:hypothetical protein